MCHLQLSGSLHSPLIPLNCKAMVLRGDEDLARFDFLYGMIPAAMTVRHFRSRTTEGQAEELMPQADAKDRDSRCSQSANNTGRVGDGIRIAGPIREEYSVR